MQPTQVAYTELETAYDFFNTQLFNGELPGALLTLQRDKRSYGYFASERFANGNGERSDEIAMNPLFFAVIPAVEIMQTLAHEMVHQWQFHFGTPGRRGYHNLEWAAKMEEVGLMPSDTGEPGGKKVGEKMADYVISGGKFETAYCELVGTQFAITWKDRLPSIDGIKNVMAGEVEGIEPLSLDALGVRSIDQNRSRPAANTVAGHVRSMFGASLD